MGEDPVIFATALETLAVKAFGDMGQTARLRLIPDRFIAGHGSCELRRHLDSVHHETPIRDVVDRCRVWESHDDPAVRRVSKPSPDPIYPAYVVEDSDNISETIQVAAVTRLKSGPDQLEDLLRRLLTAVDTPAPIPEVPVVEKLLQRLVAETQSSASARESSGVGGIVKKATVVSLGTTSTEAATSTATCPTELQWSGVFLMWEVGSCCDPLPKIWTSCFRLCSRDGGQRRLRGGGGGGGGLL